MDAGQEYEGYERVNTAFHDMFKTPADSYRIATIYNDEETCRGLPHDPQAKWLRYHQYFASCAREASASEGEGKRWALNVLLSIAFSSDLNSEDSREFPFGPLWQSCDGKQKSMNPASLTENELVCLSKVLDSASDPFLRARLGDVLWACRNKLPPEKDLRRYARIALVEYVKTPLDAFSWYGCSGKVRWYRAVKLSKMFSGEPIAFEGLAGTLLAPVKNGDAAVLKNLDEIAVLIVQTKLPLQEGDGKMVWDALRQQFSAGLSSHDDVEVRRGHFALSVWQKIYKPDEQMDCIHQQVGDYFHAKAMTFFKDDVHLHDGRGMAWAEDASQVYTAMSPVAREAADVKKKLQELRFETEKYLKRTENSFSVCEFTWPDDVTDRRKLDSVFGKMDVNLAVCVFLLDVQLSDLPAIRERAKKAVETSLFRQIMPTVFLQDGRRVGKEEPASGSKNGECMPHASEGDEVFQYRLEVELLVQMRLLPAYDCMREKFALKFEDFEELCRESDWVPDGHAKAVAKGLHAGWNGDFWMAVSLLCPQVEANVRQRMKAKNVLTTTLQRGGLDYEVGLSNLLDREEIGLAIPDEMELFELRALFSGRVGYAYNFRNNLEHGLFDDAAMRMPGLMYAWWFVFKQVFNGVKNVQ